jgi:hypothetical protein
MLQKCLRGGIRCRHARPYLHDDHVYARYILAVSEAVRVVKRTVLE